ncbi:DUF3450 domain-containing protein [uncultured Photobacterium sp.]|uniref:DUF3450 domain-containing protein n=1 Tax=uncultured Photobacterium sp. TaxID=173973 RepID=UPI0026368C13|nr:DUF3450 domain-containing protein [uncultured Photobacterium sp.]
MKRNLWLSLALFSLSALTPITRADSHLEPVIETQKKALDSASLTHKKIETIDDNTDVLIQEFHNVLRETALTSKYNQNLSDQIAEQEKQKQRLIEQRASLARTRQQLIPQMGNMIDVLDQFITNDVPFLWDERQARIQEIKKLQGNPTLDTSDKFRRILEAYQIETEYGSTIESWQAPLPFSDSPTLMTQLRIGRLALYYLTPDQQQGGMWNSQSKSWIVLSDEGIRQVSNAIKLAEQQISPQLLSLPVYRAD